MNINHQPQETTMEAELRAIRKITKELNELPAGAMYRVMDYVDAWLQETVEAATAPVAAEDVDASRLESLERRARQVEELASGGKSTG